MGDEVYMVRTGTGPNGQPSYTPMNMAEHGGKPLTGKFAKKFEDDGILGIFTYLFLLDLL